MMRRGIGALLLILSVGCGHVGGSPAASRGETIRTGEESRVAFSELIATMRAVETKLNAHPAATPEAYRALLHGLQYALVHGIEQDRGHPQFLPSVTPTMKLLGDNPDARYHRTVVRGDRRYRIRGDMDGAKFVSVTIQEGPGDGSYADGIVSVRNSNEFSVDGSGRFEITLGPEPSASPNHMQLTPRAADITVRHYYYSERSPYEGFGARGIPVSITPLDPVPAPPPMNEDARMAESLRRVTNYLRDRTIAVDPKRQDFPAFASRIPNVFPVPASPGAMSFANAEALYSQAPFLLRDDEALVLTGRFPDSQMANVTLWNAYLQTFDYRHRQVSLNSEQTRLEADGTFRIIVAHRDPGHPNWLDTEGRNFGLVFWRFLLPEGDIEPITAEVVKFDDLFR